MKKNLLIVCIIIFFAYTQYILWGGFGSCDDLAYVSQMKDHNSISAVFSSLNKSYASCSRFISNYILSLSLYLFQDNPTGYIIINVAVWLLSITIILSSVKPFISRAAIPIVLLILALPTAAASFIYSPYFSGIAFAILFWAISLKALHLFSQSNWIILYILVFVLLFTSLLSYELCLPLFILQALNPYYFLNETKHETFIQSIKKILVIYTIPVILVILCVSGLKFLLNNQLSNASSIPYGFQSLNLKSILQGLYWFFTVIVEIPLLLLSVLPYIMNLTLFIAVIFTIIFFILYKKEYFNHGHRCQSSLKFTQRYFLTAVILSLLSCPLIFIISGYPAVTYGSYNRLMLSTHILLCILSAVFIQSIMKKRWAHWGLGIVLILFISSFIVQQNNYIKSWKIRKTVFSDIVNLYHSHQLTDKSVIIACIPFYFQNNYNNEEIFWLSWDFIGGLSLYGVKAKGFPMNYYSLVDEDRIVVDDQSIRYRFSNIKLDNDLWYYEYNQESKESKMIPIKDKIHLLEIFNTIKVNEINKNKRCLREHIRLKLKNMI